MGISMGSNPDYVLPKSSSSQTTIANSNPIPVQGIEAYARRPISQIRIVAFPTIPPSYEHDEPDLQTNQSIETSLPTLEITNHKDNSALDIAVFENNSYNSYESKSDASSNNDSSDEHCAIMGKPSPLHNNDELTNMATNGSILTAQDHVINENIFLDTLHIPYNDHVYQREISPGFISVFRIYDISNKARVPFYLHDKLIETIGREIVQNNFDAFDQEFKRQAFVQKLCRNSSLPRLESSQYI
jgi:hypothetical protein